MKCIIVDDEALARDGMEILINQVDSLELLGQFSNPIQASNFLAQHEVDLIFLDIELPGMTGLDFIKSLKITPMIILCTAYPQHALQAYDLEVLDYLVKPIKLDRFLKAVNKTQQIFKLQNQSLALSSDEEQERIFIKSDRKYIPLDYKDILFIQGMKDYVKIQTTTYRYMVAINLKTIMKQLPAHRFTRINKSHIINVNKIQSVGVDNVIIENHELTLGNTYKDAFIETFVNKNLIRRN